MNKTNETSERKVRRFPRGDILDILLVKESLILMKKSKIERTDMSYFDNFTASVLPGTLNESFKSISFRTNQHKQQ